MLPTPRGLSFGPDCHAIAHTMKPTAERIIDPDRAGTLDEDQEGIADIVWGSENSPTDAQDHGFLTCDQNFKRDFGFRLDLGRRTTQREGPLQKLAAGQSGALPPTCIPTLPCTIDCGTFISEFFDNRFRKPLRRSTLRGV